jgi:hypothetical protein
MKKFQNSVVLVVSLDTITLSGSGEHDEANLKWAIF